MTLEILSVLGEVGMMMKSLGIVLYGAGQALAELAAALAHFG